MNVNGRRAWLLRLLSLHVRRVENGKRRGELRPEFGLEELIPFLEPRAVDGDGDAELPGAILVRHPIEVLQAHRIGVEVSDLLRRLKDGDRRQLVLAPLLV